MGYRHKPIKAKTKFNTVLDPQDPLASTGLGGELHLSGLPPAAHTACHQLPSRAAAVSVAIPWVLASPNARVSWYIWTTLSLTASPRGLLRDSDLATVPSLNFSSQPFNPGPSTATKAAPSPVASPSLSLGTLTLHTGPSLIYSHRSPDTFKPVPITKFGCQHKMDQSLPSQLTLYPSLLASTISERKRSTSVVLN